MNIPTQGSSPRVDRSSALVIRARVILLLAAAFFAATATAADPGRGQQLYDNHCTACHDSLVHIRNHRKADSLAAVRDQIIRWREVLELPWSGQEIDDVLAYLNQQYYSYAPSK